VKKHTHQIVARIGLALGTHGIGVHEHVHRGLTPLLWSHARIEPERLFGPLEDLGTIFFRDADHVGNDMQRKPQSKIVD